MLRHTLPVCLLLALCGCGDSSKTPPATATTAAREVPEAVTPEPVVTVKTETAAQEKEVTAGDADEMAEGTPKALTDDDREDEIQNESSVDAIFTAAQKAVAKNDFKGATEALEKGLESNPDNVDILITLVKLNLNLAMQDPEKPEYSLFIRAADYVRQLVKAEPKLDEDPQFGKFAGMVFFKEACALAVDKKTDEALKALQAATESGFADISQVEKSPELESVRELPAFSEFLAKAKEANRERRNKEVDEMFAATKPFDFDFELTDIEGNAIAKADFKGKVLIVDIWGTWCPPCRAEIPHFVELVNNYKEKGLEIVGLNSEREDDAESVKTIQEFHKDKGMNYRCALMKQDIQEDMLKQVPGFEGFPTTIFFDRAGKIRVLVVGPRDYDTLEAVVTRLLEEKSEEPGA